VTYQSDKRIFLSHYKARSPKATASDRQAAWRAYFVGARVEAGARVADAETEYQKLEPAPRSAPTLTPNPERRQLAGGHPHELTTEVAIYTKPGGGIFVGALLEGKRGQRHIELTGTEQKFFRLSEGSRVLRDILQSAGYKRSVPPGFTELDALVRRFSDDPEGFVELTAKDPDAEWVDASPRAAVLARWGMKGERAAKYL